MLGVIDPLPVLQVVSVTVCVASMVWILVREVWAVVPPVAVLESLLSLRPGKWGGARQNP